MKIRAFDRISSIIIALVLIAVTLFLAGVAWNIIKQPVIDEYVSAIYEINLNSWIMTGIACVVLIMAAALLFTAFAREKKGGRYLVINNLEAGNIRIADSTFKDMIKKNADEVLGVRDCTVSVKNIDKTIQIFIKVSIAEDLAIPTICAEIQKAVKTNIESICGIVIEKVNVIVDNKIK